jgi:hypothetical protein
MLGQALKPIEETNLHLILQEMGGPKTVLPLNHLGYQVGIPSQEMSLDQVLMTLFPPSGPGCSLRANHEE